MWRKENFLSCDGYLRLIVAVPFPDYFYQALKNAFVLCIKI